MVDPNTRQGKRTPVTLKIKFKSETLEQFIERYAVDVSQGGIFIRTKEPLAVGTQMRFEFQLRDASPLIAGEGTVVWTRENDPSRPAIAPGMGVRFDRLAEGSQSVLERILTEKAKQAPSRPSTESTKPPMFTDTPTRVAPAPVQEALLGNESTSSNTLRRRPDSFNEEKGTPLPRPMPFHSDADDFDDQAFEEATKVRALDDLIAQTAPEATQEMSADAVDAQLRRAAPSTPPPVERESAPLPSPPETSRPNPKILDTTPSPRSEVSGAIVAASDAAASAPALPAAPSTDGQRTRLGMEPAKASTRPGTTGSNAVVAEPASRELGEPPAKASRASAASEPVTAVTRPAKSGGGAGTVIVLLLAVAAAAAAIWFFVLRDKAVQNAAPPDQGSAIVTAPVDADAAGSNAPGSGSDVAMVGSGSADVGSGSGSAVVDVGSGSAGSAAVAPTTAVLVETTLTAVGDKAKIEVLGTDQVGPSPLKAKLEKDKAYKARVTAPGFATLELDFKGGDPKTVAKLAPKPRVVRVMTDPPGAAIFIDNAATGKTTPFDVELSKAQSARKVVRVSIRKGGFKTVERVLDVGKYTEDGARLFTEISETLVVQQVIVRPPPPVNTGSGSAAPTETGAGSGSAAPPPPADPPKDPPKDAPAEPEPEFMNKPAP